VENVGQTPAPDGMLKGADGSVYPTDLENSAVVRWDPESRRVEQVIADKCLLWPDTLSWGPNGEMYVTASQIENMPWFNNGKSTLKRKGAGDYRKQLAEPHVHDIMKPSPLTISPRPGSSEIAEKFVATRFNYLYVADRDRFIGAVSLHNVKNYLNTPELAKVV
jgi:hypothetical protein